MKTLIFIVVAVLASSNSFAADNYKCFSVDDNEPYGIEQVDLVVESNSKLSMQIHALKVVTETYELDATYKSKSESMKNYLKFNVINAHYDAYGEGPVTPFYVEKALLNGGYQLRRGGMGGFIKTPGHGYSWASYLCVLQ